ncbi:MAG: SAM-dependent methyltransferase, partial [Candidatus Omnitrophota bacterium]
TLARDILDAAKEFSEKFDENEIGKKFFEALQYTIVEISPALIERQKKDRLKRYASKVEWINASAVDVSLKDVEGVFLSNELLDAFPIHRVKIAGGKLREAYVTYRDGKFVEVWDEPSTPEIEAYVKKICSIEDIRDIDDLIGEKTIFGKKISGLEIAVNLDALRWMENISKSLKKGYVLTIDYGSRRRTLKGLAKAIEDGKRTQRKATRGYSGPGREMGLDEIYLFPGRMDITSDIYFPILMSHGSEMGLETEGILEQDAFFKKFAILERISDDVFFILVQSRGMSGTSLIGTRNAAKDVESFAKSGPEDEAGADAKEISERERVYRLAALNLVDTLWEKMFDVESDWTVEDYRTLIVGLIQEHFGPSCSPEDAENIINYIIINRITYSDGSEKQAIKLVFSSKRLPDEYPELFKDEEEGSHQMGNCAYVESLEISGGRAKAKVKSKDTRKDIPPIDLTPRGKLHAAALKSYFEAMEDLEEAHKKVILSILSLLEKSPPKLYTFNVLVEDLFGFSSPFNKHRLIALHKNLATSFEALFHESCEYLVGSGMLRIKFKGKFVKWLYNLSSQKVYKWIIKRIMKILGLKGELVLRNGTGEVIGTVPVDGEALFIALKDVNDPHYLLRSLQRMTIERQDKKLTHKIKRGRKLNEAGRLETYTKIRDAGYIPIAPDVFPEFSERLQKLIGREFLAQDMAVYSPLSDNRLSLDFAETAAHEIKETADRLKAAGRSDMRVLVIGTGTGIDAMTAVYQAKKVQGLSI